MSLCTQWPRFRRIAERLASDTRGATIVEFAMVAPVMCLLLMGAFDVSHTLYTRGVLQGIVQKTGRDSTLETSTDAGRQATLDARVTTQAKALVNGATIDITRRYYRTFSDAAAARAEDWTDTDNDGTCNHGEPYTDANLNNVWDADGGNAGQGGAKDAVVYTVEMRYPHLFPLWKMIGASPDVKLTASTVLRNQPYGDQASYATPVVRNCA